MSRDRLLQPAPVILHEQVWFPASITGLDAQRPVGNRLNDIRPDLKFWVATRDEMRSRRRGRQ